MRRSIVPLLALALGCACAYENRPAPQELDRAFFECNVEPILQTSCAYFACHGDPGRSFLVFGPNRLRLDVEEHDRRSLTTQQEHDYNYRAALAFAEPHPGYEEPLLLMKPLEPGAGGAYHETLDRFGGMDVFQDREDGRALTIEAWLAGATEDPSCRN